MGTKVGNETCVLLEVSFVSLGSGASIKSDKEQPSTSARPYKVCNVGFFDFPCRILLKALLLSPALLSISRMLNFVFDKCDFSLVCKFFIFFMPTFKKFSFLICL